MTKHKYKVGDEVCPICQSQDRLISRSEYPQFLKDCIVKLQDELERVQS